MPSTYSPLMRLELMQTGEKSATWGDITNTNLGTLLEKGIAGTASISVTSGDVTLTALNGADDQARCVILLVSGTPGVSRNIVAPSISKTYVVINGSNAAVVLKGAATTGITVPAGQRVWTAWNGSDFVSVGVPVESPSFTGTTTATNLTVTGATTLNGNVSVGDASSDTLSFAASAVTWPNNPTHSGAHTFSGAVTLAQESNTAVLNVSTTDTNYSMRMLAPSGRIRFVPYTGVGGGGLIDAANGPGTVLAPLTLQGSTVSLSASTGAYLNVGGATYLRADSGLVRASVTAGNSFQVWSQDGTADKLRVFPAVGGVSVDVSDPGETTAARTFTLGQSNTTLVLGSTAQFYKDSNGYIGIGNTSPGTTGRLSVNVSGTGFSAQSTPLWTTNGTGTFRITYSSTSAYGVGANEAWLHSNKRVNIGSEVSGEGTRFICGGVEGGGTDASGVYSATAVDGGGLRAYLRTTPDGSKAATLTFYGHNNSSVDQAAGAIRAPITNGTAGAEASSLLFQTRTGGSALTTRMTLDNNGNLGVNKTPSQALDVALVRGTAQTAESSTGINWRLAASSGYAAGVSFYDTTAGLTSQWTVVRPPATDALSVWRGDYYAGAGSELVRFTSTTTDLKAGSGSLRMNGHITRFESAESACPTANTTFSFAHGGSRAPDSFMVVLRCKTAEAGFSVGDEIQVRNDVADNNREWQITANASNVYAIYIGVSAPAIRNSSYGLVAITTGNWKVVARAVWL